MRRVSSSTSAPEESANTACARRVHGHRSAMTMNHALQGGPIRGARPSRRRTSFTLAGNRTRTRPLEQPNGSIRPNFRCACPYRTHYPRFRTPAPHPHRLSDSLSTVYSHPLLRHPLSERTGRPRDLGPLGRPELRWLADRASRTTRLGRPGQRWSALPTWTRTHRLMTTTPPSTAWTPRNEL